MWLACWPHMATLAAKKRVPRSVPRTSQWENPRGTIQLSPFGISSNVRVLLQGFNTILIGLGEHPLAAWSRGADCYFLWKFQFVSPKPQPNDTRLQSLDLVPLTHVLQTNDREGRRRAFVYNGGKSPRGFAEHAIIFLRVQCPPLLKNESQRPRICNVF